MRGVYQTSRENDSITGISFKRKASGAWSEPNAAIESVPEGLPSLDYRDDDPPPRHHKYHASLQTMIPFRSDSESHPLDDAGLFAFTTFAWMTPMMWNLFRNRLDRTSISLSPHDGADVNSKRFKRLWEQEVSKVGLEKASLTRVFMRFQRTRLLVAFVVSVIYTFVVFIGPVYWGTTGLLEESVRGRLSELSATLLEVMENHGEMLVEIQALHSRFAIDWQPGPRRLVYLKSAAPSVVCTLAVEEGYPSSGRATLVSVRRDAQTVGSQDLQHPKEVPSLTEWLEFLSSSAHV